jgi:hypothetical protein
VKEFKSGRVARKKQVPRFADSARDDKFRHFLISIFRFVLAGKMQGVADPFLCQGKLRFGHYTEWRRPKKIQEEPKKTQNPPAKPRVGHPPRWRERHLWALTLCWMRTRISARVPGSRWLDNLRIIWCWSRPARERWVSFFARAMRNCNAM